MNPLRVSTGRWTLTVVLALMTPGISSAAGAAPGKGAATPKGPPGNSRPTDAVSAADLTVLQKLHDANQMEIQMGQLAQAKGVSKGVKAFGKQLVHDHTRADERIAAFLKMRGLDVTALAVTTSADPAHALTADKGGGAFDASFAAQMVKDHQKSVDLVQSAARNTADPQLKALCDELLPTLQKHKETAQGLVDGKGRV